MQEKRLELSWYCYHTDLNRARLPIPPFLHVFCKSLMTYNKNDYKWFCEICQYLFENFFYFFCPRCSFKNHAAQSSSAPALNRLRSVLFCCICLIPAAFNPASDVCPSPAASNPASDVCPFPTAPDTAPKPCAHRLPRKRCRPGPLHPPPSSQSKTDSEFQHRP